MDANAIIESQAEDQSQPEPIRVLIPSKLGSLGIDFCDEVITRLVILPPRAERKHYSKLADIDRSDFLDECFGRISEYLAGARRNLGLEWSLETAELDDFSRRVLLETSKIAYGKRLTYQKLASLCGAPDSYRVVRSVLIANPIPLLIPCHRVTPRKGGGGSYVGGPKKKEWLLKLEQSGLKNF